MLFDKALASVLNEFLESTGTPFSASAETKRGCLMFETASIILFFNMLSF
jgi:hypothetical protein